MSDRLHRFDVQGVNQVAANNQRPLSGVECHRPRDRRVRDADYPLWTAQPIIKHAADLEPRRPYTGRQAAGSVQCGVAVENLRIYRA